MISWSLLRFSSVSTWKVVGGTATLQHHASALRFSSVDLGGRGGGVGVAATLWFKPVTQRRRSPSCGPNWDRLVWKKPDVAEFPMDVATTGRTNGRSFVLLSFKEERRYENWNTTTIFSNYFPTRKWPVVVVVWEERMRGGGGGGGGLSKFKGS